MKIKSIKAREILNSRGWPTIEVDLETSNFFVKASVPSGTSKGKYEAVELRDGGKRYHGRGVLKAITNINEIIAPKLIGRNLTEQKEIDNLMIELDGTKDKSKLGANSILAVSIACCRAGSKVKNIPLYKYISQISDFRLQTSDFRLPTPCFLLIEGGLHAGNDLDIQEFMVSPEGNSFEEQLQIGAEIYHTLSSILEKEYGKNSRNVGYEGGFAPLLSKSKKVLDLILRAIKESGYQNKVKIVLDVAASSFFKEGVYQFEGENFTREKLLNFYKELLGKYPIFAIEDPFSEDDWEGWKEILNLRSQISDLLIIGDDLLVTNPERIKEAKEKKACNGIILKPNQIGTVTEAIAAAKLASQYDWKTMVSHRSGETNDDFISDFGAGLGADFIKSGAPVRGERVAKYNRLLKIEKEI